MENRLSLRKPVLTGPNYLSPDQPESEVNTGSSVNRDLAVFTSLEVRG